MLTESKVSESRIERRILEVLKEKKAFLFTRGFFAAQGVTQAEYRMRQLETAAVVAMREITAEKINAFFHKMHDFLPLCERMSDFPEAL